MSDAMGDSAPADESSGAPDDLADISEADYAVAAETLAQEGAQVQEPATEPDEAEEVEEPDGTPREQRYRQRARDAEAEVGQLRELVDGMQRSEIQRLAADLLADPADLFRDGATVADLLDARGRVDPAKLGGVVDRLLVDHPHWRKPLASYSGPLHSGSANTRLVDRLPNGFVSAFGPKSD